MGRGRGRMDGGGRRQLRTHPLSGQITLKSVVFTRNFENDFLRKQTAWFMHPCFQKSGYGPAKPRFA